MKQHFYLRLLFCAHLLWLTAVLAAEHDAAPNIDPSTLAVVRSTARLVIQADHLDIDWSALNKRGQTDIDAFIKSFDGSGAVEIDLKCNLDAKTFSLHLKEKNEPHRTVSIEHTSKPGLLVSLETPGKSSTRLEWGSLGSVVLTSTHGDEKRTIEAGTFVALLEKDPVSVQVEMLHPLADWGIEVAPHSALPVVMAAAVSAFWQPEPEIKKKVDALLEQLHDGDDIETATGRLIKIYPLAIGYLQYSAKMDENQKVKDALKTVIAAHPGIQKAIPYVLEKHLNSDRDYMQHLADSVPVFRAAARAIMSKLDFKDARDDIDPFK